MLRPRFLGFGLAALLAASMASSALAQNLPVKDASGTTQSVCAQVVSSVLHPCHLNEGVTVAGVVTRILLEADGSQDVYVKNFPSVQPISATALPLPAGAATQATQAAVLSALTGTLKVTTPTPAAPLTGQSKIVTSGTAVAIGSAALANGVVVKAAATNSGTIFVGPSGVATTDDGTGNGYPLAPGEAASFAIANVSSLFINGLAVGDKVYWEGN